MRPKVSIIVPIYNVEKYLDRCVQSLINQTLQDIEIIMVDDGSPDNCPRMCDEYAAKDKRIKVIHKKNAGLGMARNSGLEIATGEYVTFVDSDDFIDLKTCGVIYKKLVENDLDICYYERCMYDDGRITYKKTVCSGDLFFTTRTDIDSFLLNMIGFLPSNPFGLRTNIAVSVCTAFFKLDKVISSGVKFVSEKKIASEDMIFQVDYLPTVERIAYTPCTFYYYFLNPCSITHTWTDKKYERLMATLNCMRNKLDALFLPQVYEDHYNKLVLNYYKVIINFISIDSSLSDSYKKTLLQRMFNNPLMKAVYRKETFRKYSIRDKIIAYCLKYKLMFPLLCMYRIKYKK